MCKSGPALDLFSSVLTHIPGREWLTTGVAGEAFALAGGGVVGKQGVLLVVAVDGARGDDVVLVLVHQGQLGVVTHCRQTGWNYNCGEAQYKLKMS